MKGKELERKRKYEAWHAERCGWGSGHSLKRMPEVESSRE